ncbi:MAG TPA: S1C family serine protease [Burkholderiales bacterium]|nr:S1C family serine protease [Burkholderiales bacterium]
MAEEGEWAFPEAVRPQQGELRFDLETALDAVVLLRSEIPDDAFTASILGTERAGNGIVIRDDGLVLTIGYLITEAQSIWLTTNAGKAVAGYPLAYDQVTGFGLVQPLGRLDAPALPLGSAQSCEVGDNVVVIGHGGHAHALKASVIARREFAGYWEYLIDEALFTAPAHPQWGGAAVVGMDGKLVGIGSLLVEEAHEGKQAQGNMVVPIDLLTPILHDMTKLGRPDRSPRPWLGMYAAEAGGQIVVGGLAQDGPAQKAGVRQGDLVLEVAGKRVTTLAQMFRGVWGLGAAGTSIPLTLAREGSVLHVNLRSADRNGFLKKPLLH